MSTRSSVSAGWRAPAGPVPDIMLLISIGALLMGVNASMADGSRALYGAALDGLVPRQFEKLNRHQVPARAILTAVVMNILLIIFVSNPISILVAANLGYLLAILLAVGGPAVALKLQSTRFPRLVSVPTKRR